jgi:transaldolase
MLLFLDSTDSREIADLADTGLIDGVTTNPSLVAKSGRDMREVLREICAAVGGPVSAEAVAADSDRLVAEGRVLREVAPNIVVKLPLTMDGLKACRVLRSEGAQTNVTLCFSAGQALLAAKAGATYVSPFIGRLDDAGQDGCALLRDIRSIYDRYGFATKILAASIRHVGHVRDAALAGADCATLPPAVFRAVYRNALTDQGLEAFLKDWASTGQSIL